MKMLLPRAAHFTALSAKLDDADGLAAIHADTEVPPDISGWLERLALLNGVPLNHLVPDEQMLPTESIRFFVVDSNWINALLEGACSIGRSSSADRAHDEALATSLYAAAAPPAQASGFLLRSAVVSGWPSLEVTAFAKGNVPLGGPLRMQLLAPALLLYIVEGLIDRIEIREPAEGLHFGIDIDNDNAKELRWLAVPEGTHAERGGVIGHHDGAAPRTVTVAFRADTGPGSRTLKIAKLAADMDKALKKAPAAGSCPTSAEFALQLVEGVQLVGFTRS